MNVRPCTPPMSRVSHRCPTLRGDEPSVHLGEARCHSVGRAQPTPFGAGQNASLQAANWQAASGAHDETLTY